ncbi:MAG: asparagine synthetase B family protein [Acidobacteria bacterium]|nr:MAG: asparagine synthetase B family protein [Acidobacteriota bacterium]
MQRPIARLIDRTDPAAQQLLGVGLEEARRRLLSDDPAAVCGLRGSFALVARDGERVCLARSLDRPLRYFLAKEAGGPMLVVADRMSAIRAVLEEEGYGEQFHPSYTRMVPAHHVVTLRLVGCPDPNPSYRRFFAPPRATLPADLDRIGERYAGALLDEVGDWLAAVPEDEPLGVLFSGGVDSGAVLLAVYHQLLARGQSPARLKAFTLSAGDGDPSPDLVQARRFLRQLDLEFLGEAIEVPAAAIDPLAAVELIEDYKPLDVECAAVALALCRGIRARYPDWRLLVDGDGGDENLKDYPIEENPELTIRSVVNNPMLYQEGWGVDAIKHSLTYSGGLSRGCVRGWAPARACGFVGFSPFTRPAVVAAAEAIPFAELTGGDHQRLYRLKGEIVRRGLRRHLGIDMPIFPKRRFQHGAVAPELAARRFNAREATYRRHFLALHA